MSESAENDVPSGFVDGDPLADEILADMAENDHPTVCIAHGRFIPCRSDGGHRYTANPYWVKSVRDYHGSPIEDLTWEPAWEHSNPPG